MDIERQGSSERASQIVVHGGTIYLSGQVAADVTVDIQAQTRSCIEKIEALLARASSDKDHMLSVTIFLKNMSDFAAMNEVWNAWLADGEKPARACVSADMARDAILVEICVVAAVK